MQIADVGISLVDDAKTLKVLEYGSAGLPVVQVEGAAESVFGDRVTFCSLDPVDVANAVELAQTQEENNLATFARKRN